MKNKDGRWARTGRPIRMVTRESATEKVPGEEVHHQICINADHSNMVKFDERCDPSYRLVLRMLKDIYKEKDKIIDERKKLGQ